MVDEPKNEQTPEPTKNNLGERKPDTSEAVKSWISQTHHLGRIAFTDWGEFSKTLRKEFLNLRYGLVLGVIVFFAWAAWYGTHHHYEKRIVSILADQSVSNAFLLGRIEQNTKNIARFEKTIEEIQAESNATVQRKDVEIQRLTTENASKEQQLAFIHTLPEKSMSLYSNLVSLSANYPTNQQQFEAMTEALTNMLSEMAAGTPSFKLSINETFITNGATIQLDQSRTLQLQVLNASTVTGEGVTVCFVTPLDLTETNLVSDGWTFMPKSRTVAANGIGSTPVANCWRCFADRPLPGSSFWDVNRLQISTNYTWKAVRLEFQVYANKSKVQSYHVVLVF
ncbi:MAG: hypothetical protein EPO07_17520 [Verrucomicrobia bacterium]|nr:MAG: hypothetical protein EPO07_17520 [Verrucomicrobiota bacterium]